MSSYPSPPTRIVFKGEVGSRGEVNALIHSPGDVVLVRRGHLRMFVIACPDGCGAIVPINLDPGAGKAWKVYQSKRGLSLYPSVWRDSGCGSHFIVWDNSIFLFQIDSTSDYSITEDPNLEKRVMTLMETSGPVSFEILADRLNEVPWAVLEVCRKLTQEGMFMESPKGTFKRRG